jgi:hypothetical protein
MKNLLFFLILIITSLFFSGCPYSSKFPIDKPSLKVENNFLGNWIEEKSSYWIYEVKKLNDYEYLIYQTPQDTTTDVDTSNTGPESFEFKKDFSEKTTYYAHFSKIKDFIFLNLLEKKNDVWESESYYIYKFDLKNNDEFKLTEVTSLIKEKFNNSADLKKYIEKYMDAGMSFFYGEEKVYKKLL